MGPEHEHVINKTLPQQWFVAGDCGAAGDQDEQRETQRRRQRWFAATPTPQPLDVVRGPRPDRFLAQEAAQIFLQFPRAAVTIARPLGQAFEADRSQIGRDRGVEQLWRKRFDLCHQAHEFGQTVADEGRTAREQMKQQGAH